MVYQVFETISDVNLFLNLKSLPIISGVNRSCRQENEDRWYQFQSCWRAVDFKQWRINHQTS